MLEMQLGCLDDALQHVRVPRLHGGHEKHLLEQRDISLAGLVADRDAAAELLVIDQLPGMLRQKAYEFRQLR